MIVPVFFALTAFRTVPTVRRPGRRSRRPAGNADRGPDQDPGSVGVADRLPGMRERAPRRNALVALAYLVSLAALVRSFGWLLPF